MNRVLIIDDDAALRVDLTQTLQDWGYDVRNAASGLNGARLIKEWSPHLVLCDIHMPFMSGPDLRRKMIGTGTQGSDISFLFMSAKAPASIKSSGLDASVDGFVSKPIDYNVLRDKLQTQLIIYNRALSYKRTALAAITITLGIAVAYVIVRLSGMPA